jgi:fibro-slime domain-containing protein
MDSKRLMCALAAVGLLGGVAQADQQAGISLTGIVRDFKVDHPDMDYPHKRFGVVKNLVKPELCEEGKPILNTSMDYTRGMISGVDSFNQWFRDVPGVNISFTHTIDLKPHPDKPGVYYFARNLRNGQSFFPADGKGWNEMITTSVGTHNYYFTYELRTKFHYSDPADRDYVLNFEFVGDDDVWVFINGKLAVDIGGVHAEAAGSVNLDADAAKLGLVPGENYELVVFFAERHVTQSNFQIMTTLELEEIKPTTVSPLYD